MPVPVRRQSLPGLLACTLLAAAGANACAAAADEPPQGPSQTTQLEITAPASHVEEDAPIENGVQPMASAEVSAEAEASPRLRVILREGEMPVGSDKLPVNALGLAVTDGKGVLAFTGRLDDNGVSETFVWHAGELIWRASDVDGTAPEGPSPLMGIGNQDEFVFQTMVRGRDSLWSQSGLLLQEGQAAPGMGASSLIQLSRSSTMTPSGTAYWVSDFTDGRGVKGKGRVLYRSPGAKPDAIEVVLRSDDLVDGFPISRPRGLDLNYQISDNGEHLVQVMNLVTGSESDNDVLYVNGHIALREGDAAGEADSWKRFTRLAINDSGDYLVVAETDAPSLTDKVIAYNGEIALREGDRLDTVSLAAQAQALAVGLDNEGRAVHLWSVGGFGAEYLFFACDAARLKDSVLLIETGRPLTLEDGTKAGVKRFSDVGHGPAFWLGPGNQLYAEISLNEGAPPGEITTREAIVSLSLPDCPQIDSAPDPLTGAAL